EGEHEGSVALLKGQEMGRFKLGSTVINLFAPGKVNLIASLASHFLQINGDLRRRVILSRRLVYVLIDHVTDAGQRQGDGDHHHRQ
ncbi:phosphatidylserine decarboxylase, partial [Salmonella enterica subsp. enterica serovar Cerro]|nr:phosphatidylserine decarboxylase [Salmonella enterica subsp. enterica serovar Cerro]